MDLHVAPEELSRAISLADECARTLAPIDIEPGTADALGAPDLTSAAAAYATARTTSAHHRAQRADRLADGVARALDLLTDADQRSATAAHALTPPPRPPPPPRSPPPGTPCAPPSPPPPPAPQHSSPPPTPTPTTPQTPPGTPQTPEPAAARRPTVPRQPTRKHPCPTTTSSGLLGKRTAVAVGVLRVKELSTTVICCQHCKDIHEARTVLRIYAIASTGTRTRKPSSSLLTTRESP